MRRPAISHVVGFDDAPFERDSREPVLVVGTVFSGLRLEGILSGQVTRDGNDATEVLARLLAHSRFFPQLQLILIQGIALAGFNVVDLEALHRQLEIPAMAITRRRPDRKAIRRALLKRVPGGEQKWSILHRLGPMDPIANLHVQRAGISQTTAQQVITHLAVHGALPEPLRVAHLIAGGIKRGESARRA